MYVWVEGGGLSTVVPQAIINPTTPATERVE